MFGKKKGVEEFEIKPISLIDCIEDSKFLPFSLIEKLSSNAYENMMSEMRDNHPRNSLYNETVDKYIQRYTYLAGEPIIPELLEILNDDLKQIIFGAILFKSFKLFKRTIKIPKETAINLHMLAKDYGKTPIEIIAEKDEYNSLDAYILNYYCLSCGKEFEAAQNKTLNIIQKRRSA